MAQRNSPGTEKALVGTWMAIEGLLDLIDDHEEGCDCIFCEDARGLLYMARMVESTLESNACRLPDPVCRLRGRGFPEADRLAEMVLSYHDSNHDSETEEDSDDE
jgi:hypothetical protein